MKRSFTKGAKSAEKKFEINTANEGAVIIIDKLKEKFIV